MDYVDMVLVQRNMLNINKFCLKCENEYFDLKRVNAWITTAVKCEVKEFIFSWRNSHPSNGEVMPDSLFTCQSLTTLDFQFPELGVLHLPNSISLPRLKILRLTNVAYEDQKSAGKLFSSCPVLEELCLTDCGWENVQFIRISAPRLKSFTLNGCLGSYMESARVNIDAPNLLSFTFCDWLPEDFVVDSFPLLQDAFLYYNYGDIESRFLPLSKFVMKLCNVKVLKISGAYFKILKLGNALCTSFPTFRNLIRLKVYDIHSLLQMKTFVNFLEFLPNLEALVINKEKFNGEVNENTLSFNKVPRCLECLKSIKIKNVKGYPKELVKFVLKHAKVLQTVIMKISYPEEDSWDFRKRKALNKNIMMQLQTSPWASPGCVVKFSSFIKKKYNNLLWQ